ncbi:MAG: DUF2461 domain-containing protein [Proteobacteria bacterium]|nr:DUF2461 domain-containing protein [Pseudomonadota bacterium]
MAYFTKELFKFLKDLSKHNNREWFQKNKERYEEQVKEPVLDFIACIRPHLLKLCPQLKVDPSPHRGSMLRIYKDTRFSHDKTPYKTNAGVHFPYIPAQKGIHAPGFYLHLEPSMCFAAAGIWHPDPQTLTIIRNFIVNHPYAWEKVLKKKIVLEGDALVKAPRGFDTNHRLIEDIKRKDFITSLSFTQAEVCGASFLKDYIAACKKMLPLMEFLIEADSGRLMK